MTTLTQPLTLFVQTGCPYCLKVLMYLEVAGIPFVQKNVANEAVVAELVRLGGKDQTPYLVDPNTGVSMYESSAIIAYLEKQYGKHEDILPEAASLVCPVD